MSTKQSKENLPMNKNFNDLMEDEVKGIWVATD